MGIRYAILVGISLSFISGSVFPGASSTDLLDLIEAKIAEAEKLYDALTLKEVKASNGESSFSYKATLNPSRMSEGGIYCERRGVTDCSLVSKKGLRGKVVVLEGASAEKLYHSINPKAAEFKRLNAGSSFYRIGGLTCTKSLQHGDAAYVCTATGP